MPSEDDATPHLALDQDAGVDQVNAFSVVGQDIPLVLEQALVRTLEALQQLELATLQECNQVAETVKKIGFRVKVVTLSSVWRGSTVMMKSCLMLELKVYLLNWRKPSAILQHACPLPESSSHQLYFTRRTLILSRYVSSWCSCCLC